MGYVYKIPKDRLLPELEEALKQLNKAWKTEDEQRDVRPLMFLLSRLDVVDPRLTGYVQTRTTAVASYDWDIKAIDKTDTAAVDAAQAAKKRCKKAIKKIIKNHISTYLYGVFVNYIEWYQNKEKAWIPKVHDPMMPYDVEYMTDSTAYPLNVAILTHEGSKFTRNKIDDPDDFVVDTYRTSHRGGLMVSILIREILLNMTLQDWANFNRKLKGLITSTYKSVGAQPGDQAAAEEAVRKAGTSNYLSKSDSIDIEFERLVDALGKDSYKEFKEALQADIAIAIKGEANLHELPKGGGSRAASQVQQMISADITWMTLLNIQDLINEQLLPADYRKSVEKAFDDELLYEFEFIIDESVDREQNGRIITQARENGMKIKRSQAYEMVGLEVPEEGDEVLEPLTSVL